MQLNKKSFGAGANSHREPIKIGVYGDLHLSSKNYGEHINYAEHTLRNTKEIARLVHKHNITHLIDPGDFSDGIPNLNFRMRAEKILWNIHDMVDGNWFTQVGNHDIKSTDISEQTYYIDRGLFHKVPRLVLPGVTLHFVDYGKENEPLAINPDTKNIAFTHGHFMFQMNRMPFYGSDPIMLDEHEQFKGLDMIVGGHIHAPHDFVGNICGEQVFFRYLGSSSLMERQDLTPDHKANFLIIEIDPKTGEIMLTEDYIHIPNADKLYKPVNLLQKEVNNNKETTEERKMTQDSVKEAFGSLEGYSSQRIDLMERLDMLDTEEYSDNIKQTAKALLEIARSTDNIDSVISQGKKNIKHKREGNLVL